MLPPMLPPRQPRRSCRRRRQPAAQAAALATAAPAYICSDCGQGFDGASWFILHVAESGHSRLPKPTAAEAAAAAAAAAAADLANRQQLEATFRLIGQDILWGPSGEILGAVPALPPPPAEQVSDLLDDVVCLVEHGAFGVGEWDPDCRMYRAWQTPHVVSREYGEGTLV